MRTEVTCEKYFSWAGTHVLQAELELLFVGEEILRELHRQVVVSEEAVEKSQHLRRTEGTQIKLLYFCSGKTDRTQSSGIYIHK